MVKARLLLDSNVISELTKPHANPAVLSRFKRYREDLCTAAPVFHELRYGVATLDAGTKKSKITAFLDGLLAGGIAVLPYDHVAAEWHAAERARLHKTGKPRPFVDGQIASIAVVNEMILVTRNVRDFKHFRDLKIKDWFAES